MKKLIYIGLTSYLLLSIILSRTHANNTEYQFPWPGVLPDQVLLYKLKVFRNKIIEKILYSDVLRVEFDLLMADKTLYAAKLLMDKGNTTLAKETALKGENHFSILVSDYAKVPLKILPELDEKIDRAYMAHQQLLIYLKNKAPQEDAQTYEEIDYFSKTNYQLIQKIRNDNK